MALAPLIRKSNLYGCLLFFLALALLAPLIKFIWVSFFLDLSAFAGLVRLGHVLPAHGQPRLAGLPTAQFSQQEIDMGVFLGPQGPEHLPFLGILGRNPIINIIKTPIQI